MTYQCDYGHECDSPPRWLELGGGSRLAVCREHYKKEMDWRRSENKRGVANPWPIPTWESLETVKAG